MALVVKDRVKETTATTGDGTLTLAGAVTGFQSFSSALSNGDTTYYAIFESSTGAFEVGLGTFTASGTTLSRDTVFSSSNSGSKISLTAGNADVFITQPATKAAYFDGSGDLTLNQDPTSNLQAATKQYVDTIAAAGVHYHDPVRVEKEGNLSATYDNGTNGVGATLTNNSTQAALVIDGVTMVVNDRVLIYEQTNAAHNGVYTVTNVGSASTNWVLTRATDADSYGPSDPDALGQGDAFFVSEGDAGAGETYVMTTEGTITFGTTNITFSQISATQIYSAGNGLTLTGTTFAAGAGTGVTVNANDIAIGQDVGTTANVTFSTVTANLTGNVTGDVTGDVTGNADTATAWATGRTISLTGDITGSATNVDGSGNVSIATTYNNDVVLGTDTSGNYVATGAVSGNGLSGSASAEGATFTVTSNATNANTASTIVFRDGSGNFSAGTITANLTGTASSATNADTVDNLHASSFLRSDANDTTSGSLTIDSSTQTSFNVEYANDGTGVGPLLRTFRDSASPAANDILGGIDFKGNNSAGSEKFYARVMGRIIDPTNASEDGAVDINVAKAGTPAWDTSGLVARFDANGMELRGDIIFEGSTANNAETTLTVTDPTADRTITLPNATGTVMLTGAVANLDMNNYNIVDVEDIGLQDRIYHDGDTDTYMQFNAANSWRVVVANTQRLRVNANGVQLGDSGNGNFQPVSGSYGSIQIDGGAHGGWEGYSIGGRAVFMHDNSTRMGLYDDVNDHWALRHTFNGATELFHNGLNKMQTTSSGINVTGTAEVDTLSFSDGSSQTSAGASTGKAIAMAIVFG